MVSVGDSTRRGKEYSKRFARSTTIACVDELCEACGVKCGINFDPGRSWRGKHPKLRYDAKNARAKNREIELLTPRESRNGTSCSPDAKSGARAL